MVGEHLRSFLRSHFPSIARAEIEAEWTGVLGFTADGFPLVGGLEVEGRDGVLVAAGFCGHGMPQCFGVGKAIAHMIQADQRGGQLGEAPELPQYAEPAQPAAGRGRAVPGHFGATDSKPKKLVEA